MKHLSGKSGRERNGMTGRNEVGGENNRESVWMCGVCLKVIILQNNGSRAFKNVQFLPQ